MKTSVVVFCLGMLLGAFIQGQMSYRVVYRDRPRMLFSFTHDPPEPEMVEVWVDKKYLHSIEGENMVWLPLEPSPEDHVILLYPLEPSPEVGMILKWVKP